MLLNKETKPISTKSARAVEYTDCISIDGLDTTNECPRYDVKQSDCEAPALDIWGMWSTILLPLLPSPFYSRMVAPDMCQIELCDIQTECKQIAYAKLNC